MSNDCKQSVRAIAPAGSLAADAGVAGREGVAVATTTRVRQALEAMILGGEIAPGERAQRDRPVAGWG